MTWRERTVAVILLIIARMVSDDESLSAELKTLANHISVSGMREAA